MTKIVRRILDISLKNGQTLFGLFFIVIVKKTFRYSNVFFYNHLYHPEHYYGKRYIFLIYARFCF